MAGEVSPDRLFYWDGERWVSAVSPDGAWRWDGAAWRPAQRARTQLHPRLPWLIAAGVIAALVIISVGGYFGVTALSKASQAFFPGGACNSPLTRAGAALTRGDSLCGVTLGDERLLADCTLTDVAPAGITVWQKLHTQAGGDWVQSSVSSGPKGCLLVAQPNMDIAFSTSDEGPPSTVVVADFTVNRTFSEFGLELACTEGGGCIDITMFRGGQYRLDVYHPGRGWANLTRGYMAPSPRTDQTNRMILSMSHLEVDVYLNGLRVTHAQATDDQTFGSAAFYLDNRNGTAAESAWLQRLYIFDSQ